MHAAPSPLGLPLSGHALWFQMDPLGMLLRSAQTHGPVVKLRLGPLHYWLVSDPALIAEVLQTRAANYSRDARSTKNIALVTGESLLTTTGDSWKRQRRLVQPIFHHKRLALLAGAMAGAAAETLARWEKAAREGRALDLASEMSRLTFTIVGRCLFGTELGARSDEVEAAFPVLLKTLYKRATQVVSLPIEAPLPSHKRFTAAMEVINLIVDDIVTARRKLTDPGDDLLGLLLRARDDEGDSLTDAEIRNQIVTFLLAGHETTAATLTWTFSLLALHPEPRAQVEAELDATPDPVADHPYLTSVLKESLRLYPSIWILERHCQEPDTLGGFDLPEDAAVIMAPWVTHRLEQYWYEPETFRPERFLGAPESRKVAESAFLPFGAGPHTCIGQHFAMMEAKIALSLLARRCRLTLVDGEMPTPLAGITLRTEKAVPVRVELR